MHRSPPDVSEQRLSRIKENLVRLGLRADLVAADASHTDSWWDQSRLMPFFSIFRVLPPELSVEILMSDLCGQKPH